MFPKLASRTFAVNSSTAPNSRRGSIYAHPKADLTDLDRLYENERHSSILLSDDSSIPTLPHHECVLTPTYATRSSEGDYPFRIDNR
jgi:hypothetical protein